MKFKKKYNSLVFLYFLSLTFCSDDVRYPKLESPNDPELPNEKLRIIQPKEGDTLWVDSNFNIVWESNEIYALNIKYSTDSGLNWKLVDSGILAEENEYYPWVIPFDTSSTVKLKLCDADDPSICSITNGNMTIQVKKYALEDMDLESLKYYPLKVGDFWIYEIKHTDHFAGVFNYLLKKRIKKDSTIYNKRYFLVELFPIIKDSTIFDNVSPLSKIRFERVDSVDSFIKYLPNNGYQDINLVDLSMKEGDEEIRGEFTAWKRIVLQKEDTLDVLGLLTQTKKYKIEDVYQHYYYDYAKDIGLYRFIQFGEYTDFDMKLRGAKLGNMIFGDTVTVN